MTFLRGDGGSASSSIATPTNALVRLDKSFGIGLPGTSSLPTLASMPTASGLRVGQATAMQVSAVYACVRIRSRDLARCAPQILRLDGTGNRTQVPDHPLTALFRRPNRVQTWFEFCEQQHTALLLRSNAYAVILRDRRGTPVELIPVNPDLVTMLEAPDGSLFYQVSQAGLWLAAVLAGVGVVVPDYDMLHLRDLTFNGLIGWSRIAAARDAIGLATVQEQQAARWAGNGARPSGVLQSDKPISQPVATRLKDQWDALQSGLANTGRTAVLEDGIKWVPMSLTSVDLEFVGARGVQVKEIARFFEVPLHKLGENEGLPRASVAELNADYVQNVVMSDATRWEQRFATTFGLPEGFEVKLDERGLLRADLGTMINAARAGVLSGLMTQNEGRVYIGYGPMPGGDKLLAPVNLAPGGSAQDGTAPDGAGRPPSGLNPGDVKAIAEALVKQLKANPNHDAQGRFSSGGDGGGAGDDASAHGDGSAESRSAVSHEIKLVVEGLAITAAAGIVAALLPEAAVVTTAAGIAEHVAGGFFVDAGTEAAKHIVADLGIDTSGAERIAAEVGAILKAADAHDAKLLAIVRAGLPAVLAHARDVLVAKVEADAEGRPHLAAAVAAIDAGRDAILAKVKEAT